MKSKIFTTGTNRETKNTPSFSTRNQGVLPQPQEMEPPANKIYSIKKIN